MLLTSQPHLTAHPLGLGNAEYMGHSGIIVAMPYMEGAAREWGVRWQIDHTDCNGNGVRP